MLSKGLTRNARRQAQRLFAVLDTASGADVPLLCLEPSDASALADDLPDLLDDAALALRVASRIMPVERYLAGRIENGQIMGDQLNIAKYNRQIVIHGHCHQKAIFGTEDIHTILNAIPGVTLEEIDAGCCGMAGSFGYEHYDLSIQIAEQRLLPAVRDATAAGKTIVACGTSCRQQLRDLLGVEAKHVVEVMQVKQ